MKDITRKPLHRSFVSSFATSTTTTAAADADAAGGDSVGGGENCCCCSIVKSTKLPNKPISIVLLQ